MTFGLLVQNNSGDLVVDSDYRNHVIVETGTVASPAAGLNTVSFASTYAIALQSMVFGRCTGDFIGFVRFTYSAGLVSGFQFAAKAGGSSFSWKLSVLSNTASGDAFGARIYDASGDLVFDAGLNYLALIDAIAITTLSGSTFVTGNTAHASGTTPFYCLSSGASYGMHQTSGAPTSGYFAICYKAVDATHVGQDWTQIASVGAVSGIAPRPASPTLLVMDDSAPAAGSGFGMTLWKGSGAVLMSMTTRLTRFMYHTLANAGASGNTNITGLDPARCVGFASPRSTNINENPHDVTLTSGNVAWAPASVGNNVQSDIYVVQYK